ncbi:MAG TPA: SH3 domain-containing protein [Kofleriaceae bacterium]|nr:SH3 domain-containing protein [Kofleriaceae bacterium]
MAHNLLVHAAVRCAVVCLLAISAGASAETRHTTEAVELHKRPGEKEPVVGNAPAHAEVTVVSDQGRWVKVRYAGVEGYVTRTTLDAPPPAQTAATWSAGRRAGDGREVTALFVETVTASPLRGAPTPSAAKLADLPPGTRLAVIDGASAPGWVRARDDQGRDGWIARGELDNSASGVKVTAVDLQGTQLARAVVRDDVPLRLAVGIGYRELGMNMSANADGGLTNYLVAADALAAVATADYARRRGRWLVGGDTRAEVSVSSPGIAYPGPTELPGKIPFRTFGVDAGVRAGLRVHDAIDLALRAGGHYDAFLPQSVNNAGMLPREALYGLTAGVRGELSPPRSRFGAAVRFDVLALGARRQTPGLEDGASSHPTALWGGATLAYLVTRRIAAFASYDLGWASTRWTGASQREPGVTDAHRVDTVQLVELGVSAGL